MNHDPFPSLSILGNYLKSNIFSHNTFNQKNVHTVAFVAQGKERGKNMSKSHCYNCKKYDNIASNDGKNFCIYCKKHGHIIKECSTRPQTHKINAFQVRINGTTSDNSFSDRAAKHFLIMKMVKEILCQSFHLWDYKVVILHLIFGLFILALPILWSIQRVC